MDIDYKNTLLMPKTDFEMKANLKNKEPSIQDFWVNKKIYDKVLSINEKNKQFILHDGPPYANGNIHVGHALNKIIKDFIVRFNLSIGNYSPIIYGWDTHGLPIENAVSKSITNYENLSVVEKRNLCKKYALEQVNIQKNQFKRLGLFTNWEKYYLTLNHSFEINELKLFAKMIEKELIFQSFKPVYWSWSSKSSLAEAEIEYKNLDSSSIFVSFDIDDSKNVVDNDVKLLIWTTTPWTIPANLAIAVNPEIEYSIIEVNNNKYLVANSLIDKLSKKLSWKEYKIIKTLKGKKLENITYKHPFINRTSPIILADYVSDTDGTGLVHNAPGFGLDDYYACKKYCILPYVPIDDDGKYTKEINDKELEGLFYLKANDLIIERLKSTNSLLLSEVINHAFPCDWRTKKPVMYRATKQWFVNIDKINKNINLALDNVQSIDKKIINRIREMASKRNEWCISRQRVWGLPIIIIFDEEHKPIYDIKLVNHIIDILNKEGVDVWFAKDASYFIPDWMDKSKKYYKEKDILDVWFDSGSSFNVLFENNLSYPADIYFEGSDQFRGWFNSSLINGVIYESKAPYKYLLQHGFVLDEKGNKMSKSLGNAVDPLKICDQYGADILRIWVSTNDYLNDLKIGNNIIDQCAEMYRKIRNTLFRYTLSNLNDFDPTKNMQKTFEDEDYYVINKLNELIKNSKDSYSNYNYINLMKNINSFIIELSQWYFDIIKDSLYCDKQDSTRRRQIQTVLYLILKNLLVILNPIIPHTCEEAYSFFNQLDKKESINLEKFPSLIDVKINDQIVKNINLFLILKDKIFIELEKARKENIIKKSNEATVYIPPTLMIDIDVNKLSKWLNVAKVIISTNSNEIIIKNDSYKKCQRCWNHLDDSLMHDDDICKRCYNVIK